MNDISFKDISIIKSGGAIETSIKSNNSLKKSRSNISGMNISKKSLKNSRSNLQETKAPFYPSSTQMSTKTTCWKKSIAENNLIPFDNEKQTLYSTWTPLNDEKSNNKLFEERKQLCLKWFETWSDNQRKIAVEDILYSCKPKQLFHTRDVLNKISPVYHLDFTRLLPRVVCLYIMSYLDPRSLSRCSQVCWYWKMLSETDQLWMPKCLRFGWNLNYIPSSFESGIWKQFYIENIKALQYIPLAKVNTPLTTERSELTLRDISNGRFGFSRFAQSSQKIQKTYKSAANLKHPPWKANNSNPNHLYRYNYLDTNAEIESKKANITNKMKKLSLDNSIKNQAAEADIESLNKTIIDQSQQKIIENLINKGQTLINKIGNTKEKHTYENFEKSFQLPTFNEDDISITQPANLFDIHRQVNTDVLDKNKNPAITLEDKKKAWALLES